MKRSRLFLGLSTCVLGVAAVAATKAHRFSSTSIRYYCTSPITLSNPNPVCLPYSGTNVAYEPGGNRTFKFTLSGKTYTLYTQGLNDGATHTCATAGICKTPLLYTGTGQ